MKRVSLFILFLFYLGAGINHLLNPGSYQKIMPPWLGWKYELVIVSGVAEILCALFLLPLYTRRVAAWCIILLLIAVFPANVQMATNYFNEGHRFYWLTLLRLPLQVVLIWWAYQFTKPFSSNMK